MVQQRGQMDIHGAKHSFSMPVFYYSLFPNVFYLNVTKTFRAEETGEGWRSLGLFYYQYLKILLYDLAPSPHPPPPFGCIDRSISLHREKKDLKRGGSYCRCVSWRKEVGECSQLRRQQKAEASSNLFPLRFRLIIIYFYGVKEYLLQHDFN